MISQSGIEVLRSMDPGLDDSRYAVGKLIRLTQGLKRIRPALADAIEIGGILDRSGVEELVRPNDREAPVSFKLVLSRLAFVGEDDRNKAADVAELVVSAAVAADGVREDYRLYSDEEVNSLVQEVIEYAQR